MGLSYADAARLMGGRDSRIVTALDRLTGGLLLAASLTGSGLVLNLFEAKGELARLSHELLRGLDRRLQGLDRFARSEQLAAAHSVLALAAYFDVLAGTELPFDSRELDLTKAEQVALATGGAPGSGRLGPLAAGLLQAEVPMPAPQRPYEETLKAMRAFYGNLSGELLRFVEGLAVWDRLDETRRQRFSVMVAREIPGWAASRYEELFRDLAVEFPEVGFWANLTDHQATREEVRQLGTGLAGLEQMLAEVAAGRVPDDRRRGLSRAYKAALRQPVLSTGDVPAGLRLPLLSDAYVNPDYRAATVGQADRFAEESWWHEQPVRDDLEGFLAGYLTVPYATLAPLLLLGQPGSGKSVLTQMLAARLPASEFLVVRVVLREVATEADLQTQIEHAVRSATGERLTWPELARSAGDALPVVLLDGFDELLQATGVSQTDYLLKVAGFQAREADQGRPVAVIVTSRTAVADRARTVDGMVVARLEPFSEAHISTWLDAWAKANVTGLAARGLRPLTVQVALAHPELSAQPLLLLMLALYDADGNPLQQVDASLGKAELYERLLASFAGREVRKSGADLDGSQFEDAVEQELLRLSVAAFAMFSRSRQWASDAELDADLDALLGQSAAKSVHGGLRAPLNAAQVVTGRFFFIHEAKATRDDTQLRSYEFLHATFGEYLIARLVSTELCDLADAAQLAAGRTRSAAVDDAFLHAILSFMPLSMRGTVTSFLHERLGALPEKQIRKISDLLLGLFRDCLGARHDMRFGDYKPVPLTVPARYSSYSANLALLAILSTGEITARNLFPSAHDPVDDWRKLALLWRSQLPHEAWTGMIGAVVVERAWEKGRREIYLRPREVSGPESWNPDPHWTCDRGIQNSYRQSGKPFSFAERSNSWLRDQARFLCDEGDDALAHALTPFAGDLDHAISIFHSYWPDQGRAVSGANALITLWLACSTDSSPDEVISAFETCLEIAILGRFSPSGTTTRESFRAIVLRQILYSQHRLPPGWLDSARARIRDTVNRRPGDIYDIAELLRLADEILPVTRDGDRWLRAQ